MARKVKVRKASKPNWMPSRTNSHAVVGTSVSVLKSLDDGVARNLNCRLIKIGLESPTTVAD